MYYIQYITEIMFAPLILGVRFGFISVIFLCITLLRIVSCGIDFNKPMNPMRRRLICTLTQYSAKYLMFWMGFSIHEHSIENKPDPERCASIIILNHTGSADGGILFSLGYVGFISKIQVKSLPIFGIAALANQAVFVDRATKDSREYAQLEIIERAKDYVSLGIPRLWPVLCICPEGTTTNGTTLLPFRRGAFVGGNTVRPITIKYYARTRDPSDSSVKNYIAALGNLMVLFNTRVDVTYHPDYTPNYDELVDAELYAQNVRMYMASKSNVPLCEMRYADKCYYAGWSEDYNSCSDYYKRIFGPACRRKTGCCMDSPL